MIIDPNAYNIYVSKLKYYDNLKEIPSSLSERVIYLPYLFEKVLPILKNEYLKNLSEGLDGYSQTAAGTPQQAVGHARRRRRLIEIDEL